LTFLVKVLLYKPQKNIHTLTERQNQSGEAKRSKSFLKESCFGSIGLSPDFPLMNGESKNLGITAIGRWYCTRSAFVWM